MTKKGTLPLLHNIQFIRRMDALVEEFPILTQDDVREFWREFKYQVYESYRDAGNWREFKSVMELLTDD